MRRSTASPCLTLSAAPERLLVACQRCGAPLPPPRSRKATTPRKWCSTRCAYQGYLDRKVAVQVEAYRQETIAGLDGIERQARILRERIGRP